MTQETIRYRRRPIVPRTPQTPTHDYYGEINGRTVVRLWVDRAGRDSGLQTQWWAKDNDGNKIGRTTSTMKELKWVIARHFEGVRRSVIRS